MPQWGIHSIRVEGAEVLRVLWSLIGVFLGLGVNKSL